MTRTGADSTNAEYVPVGKDIYLGYIDGKYRSYTQLRTRFPHSLVVPIATQASGNVGTVGDGPPDNGTWPEWVAWVVRRRAAGVDPTIYTDASSWAEATQAFTHAGVAQPHWWIAQWDDHPEVPAGAVGKQYQSVTGRYDLSLFADYWPGVDAAPTSPAPAPAPSPTPAPSPSPSPAPVIAKVRDMILLKVPPQGDMSESIWLLSGPLYTHVVDGASYSALAGAGIPVASVTVAEHDALVAGYEALTTAKTTPLVTTETKVSNTV